MYRTSIIVILILSLSASVAFAQTLTSSSYILKNPRIVIIGGNANSASYSLTNASVAGFVSGKSESPNYSLDTRASSIEDTEPSIPPDTMPPVITSLTPSDGQLFESENTILISCAAEDNNSPLYYRFSVDGNVIQDWNIDSTLNWNTQTLTNGVYPVLVEVKDIGENIVSQTIELYIVRKPLRPPR